MLKKVLIGTKIKVIYLCNHFTKTVMKICALNICKVRVSRIPGKGIYHKKLEKILFCIDFGIGIGIGLNCSFGFGFGSNK